MAAPRSIGDLLANSAEGGRIGWLSVTSHRRSSFGEAYRDAVFVLHQADQC